MRNATEKQIIRNIAVLIWDKPEKVAQLEKVQDISIHLTSADGIRIICEIYAGNIARYQIIGTRSSMTVTANTITREMMRKPRNSKPVFSTEIYGIFAGDILAEVTGLTEFYRAFEDGARAFREKTDHGYRREAKA